jgi:hypothetical protein
VRYIVPMRHTLAIIFWVIQINLVMWLAVAGMTQFQNVLVVIGLGVGAILEHVAIRHLRPMMKSLRAGALAE